MTRTSENNITGRVMYNKYMYLYRQRRGQCIFITQLVIYLLTILFMRWLYTTLRRSFTSLRKVLRRSCSAFWAIWAMTCPWLPRSTRTRPFLEHSTFIMMLSRSGWKEKNIIIIIINNPIKHEQKSWFEKWILWNQFTEKNISWWRVIQHQKADNITSKVFCQLLFHNYG